MNRIKFKTEHQILPEDKVEMEVLYKGKWISIKKYFKLKGDADVRTATKRK
jgi:hypothetical protein